MKNEGEKCHLSLLLAGFKTAAEVHADTRKQTLILLAPTAHQFFGCAALVDVLQVEMFSQD